MTQLVQNEDKYFSKHTIFSRKQPVRKIMKMNPSGMKMKYIGIRLVLTLVMAAASSSCDKNYNDIVPNVPFSFQVNLNIVNELLVPGNSVFFPNAGFGGVLIYCEMAGSYYAFDAACTNEISRSCIVENEGVLATCPCCGSQFILLSGAYPSKGPATMPLKQYNVSVVNDFTLRVFN